MINDLINKFRGEPTDSELISIDARCLTNSKNGLGRYAYNLISQMNTSDKERQIELILNKSVDPNQMFENLKPSIASVQMDGDMDLPVNHITLPKYLFQQRPKIYHALFHFVPYSIFKGDTKIVVTLHDLIWVQNKFRSYPSYSRSQMMRIYSKNAIHFTLKKADRVITVSKATKDHALEFFPDLPEDKFRVVHHGPPEDLKKLDDPKAAIPEELREKPFFLTIGNGRPYKNFESIIKALALIKDQNTDLKLVICSRFDDEAKVRKLIKKKKLQERVILLEQPSDEMLIGLYQKALAMVLPSFIEGFGFPLLEAMSLDCPVITSNCSSLIEVASDGALLIDPYSHRDLSMAMGKILMQPKLRDDLIERGRKRLEMFSWQECCAKTLSVYDELLN